MMLVKILMAKKWTVAGLKLSLQGVIQEKDLDIEDLGEATVLQDIEMDIEVIIEEIEEDHHLAHAQDIDLKSKIYLVEHHGKI